MSIDQLFYTSCAEGLGGSSGFQFAAVSPGINEAVLHEVQGLVGYEPPQSAPPRPTEAELDAFPIALSYVTLDGGSAVLSQTKYVGRDYSGRYGNFFAHLLYLHRPAADLGNRHPVDLWRSPLWVDGEWGSSTPSPLATPPPASPTRPRELIDFLDRGDRRQHLRTFLSAVAQSLVAGGRQILIVEANTDDTARWVAVASHSLPFHLCTSLTFTTYTRRPYYSHQHILGITPDAEFRYGLREINDQYVVFDFVGDRFSPLADHEWATLVDDLWYRPDIKILKGFHTFVGGALVAGTRLELDDLADALHAFSTAAGRPVSSRSTGSLLRWVERYRRLPDDRFWKGLGRGLQPMAEELTLGELAAFARIWLGRDDRACGDALAHAYLSKAIRHLAAGGSEEDLWEPGPYAPVGPIDGLDMLSILESSEVPLATCRRILRLTSRFNVPPEVTALGRLGEQRIGPALVAGTVAVPAVLELLNEPYGPLIADGLLASLERSVSSGREGLVAVVELSEGPLGTWLSSLRGRLTEGLELALSIQAASRGRMDRIEVFDRTLGFFERRRPEGTFPEPGAAGEEVRSIRQLIWRTSPITLEEGGRLLDVLPESTILASGLLGDIVNAILAAPEVTEAVMVMVHRVRALGGDAHLDDVRLGTLGVIAALTAMPGPSTRPDGELLAMVTRVAAAPNYPAMRSMLARIADWVVGLPQEDHLLVLRSVLPPSGGPSAFFDVYRRSAGKLPNPDDSVWAPAIIDRFCVWHEFQDTNPRAGSLLLSEALAPSLRAASRHHRAEVDRLVKERGRRVWKVWTSWCDLVLEPRLKW
jgi:hypothetical protein